MGIVQAIATTPKISEKLGNRTQREEGGRITSRALHMLHPGAFCTKNEIEREKGTRGGGKEKRPRRGKMMNHLYENHKERGGKIGRGVMIDQKNSTFGYSSYGVPSLREGGRKTRRKVGGGGG